MLVFSSLVPSPTPSFTSLAVRYCKRRKAERGTGNEAKYNYFLDSDTYSELSLQQGLHC